MATDRKPEDATLVDVLIDGFEKNEVLDGFHDRMLPLANELAAARKFASFVDEATRWKGSPAHRDEQRGRRLAAWSDLEIRQAGRGVLVRAKAPRFGDWWNQPSVWADDPLRDVVAWLAEKSLSAGG